ncbi:MAG: telomere resolvase [Nostoc indistinguendum CM1-VF10]|jgi:hypothetical protein|nr:telomere resolvase [Nostoc indistinguendum CM1-VF10]
MLSKYSKTLSTDIRKDVRGHLIEIGLKKPYDCRQFYGSYFTEVYVQDVERPNKSTRALLSRLLGHGEEDTDTGKTYEDMRVILKATPELIQEFRPLLFELFTGEKVMYGKAG